MYTQCPECQIAFRVTAKVLQQASGRVKCGGCSHRFNAVDHLSETPQSTAADVDQLAENRSSDPDSAEHQDKLLKKLDDLAGPEDIRIEDTGFEWRVLDSEDGLDEEDGIKVDSGDSAAMDWYIDDAGENADEKAPASADDDTPSDEQAALDFETAAPPEPRYDDSTPLPDDYEGNDLDASPKPAPDSEMPEAAADDTTETDVPVETEDPQVDLALGDPEEWIDLLDEVDDEDSRDKSAAMESSQDEQIDESGSVELPMETEEELAAIHAELTANPNSGANTGDLEGDDESAAIDALDEHDEDEDEDEDTIVENLNEDDEVSGAEDLDEVSDDEDSGIEGLSEDEDEEISGLTDLDDELEPAEEEEWGEYELAVEGSDEDEDDEELAGASEASDDFVSQITLVDDSLEQEPDPEDDSPDELAKKHDIEKELAESEDDSSTEPSADDEGDHTVGVNVREDMLRAMHDEQFAATMVGQDGSPLVETIVMEGDLIGGSDGQESARSKFEIPVDFNEPKSLMDTYVLSRRSGKRPSILPVSRKGRGAGVIVLLLVLVGQYIHTSRESLATFAAFNQTMGPLYRLMGRPVTPAWDIKGWQFETTNGSTDESGQKLTIKSRVSNRSTQPLPFPLVHVSLVDRWEDIVASRVLEPNEYLAGSPDPGRPVTAGDNFTAVITIAIPAEEVTGFKLNVCYRLDPNQLSCALEDFK